jgi:tetratricopeptide (TPR) repeat protein
VKRSFAAAALVAIVCSASAAAAQAPQDEAREQYERGVRAYSIERFDEAVAAFTRAYELDPAPILLFNIAQARWKKGENERALFYYRRYLEADPGAANRPAVEARIRELEQARASAPPPAPPPPPVVVAPKAAEPPVFVRARPSPPPPPLYRRPWFWVGVGAAAVAVAATVLLIARQRPEDCSSCNLPRVNLP